jgi:hypothetical protein
MQFSTGKRVHGNLKDQDRIFTNLYRDGDPFIKGALKRVRVLKLKSDIGRLAQNERYNLNGSRLDY